MTLFRRILTKSLGFEGLDSAPGKGLVPFGLAIALAAVAIRFFFWWLTGRVWEDALITVLHSENLVRGLGLTHFRVREPPLHGFTSPLSVLVPLMGDLVMPGYGLYWIRIVSAFCGGLTVLYVMAICAHPKIAIPRPAAMLAMAYVAFEHHQILWGMAGMETQLVTLVLLMSIYYTIAMRPTALGLSLGLCMLARPDFAFWTVAAGLYVCVVDWRKFPTVVLVALAVYAPWILFTTNYYGSPIPNTIVAKSLGYTLWWKAPNLTAASAWNTIWSRLGGNYGWCSIYQPLGPSFGGHGTGFSRIFQDYGLVCRTMLLLGGVGTLSSLLRRQWAFLPILLFGVIYKIYYTFGVGLVFGWYVVPFVAVIMIVCARGLQEIAGWLPVSRLRPAFMYAFCLAYLALIVGMLPRTFETERRIQVDIESTTRRQAARFLADVMKDNETVGCEPLGYVSYYTRKTVYDWPGLASRKVVEFSKTHPDKRTLLDMLDALRPDYILLRPFERDQARECGMKWLEEDYSESGRFEAQKDRIQDIMLLNRNIDTAFILFRKNS